MKLETNLQIPEETRESVLNPRKDTRVIPEETRESVLILEDSNGLNEGKLMSNAKNFWLKTWRLNTKPL
jgi:hypothetical protein